jgi:hypothetical protein
MSDADKVDIFDLLKHVDSGDLDYWNNLTQAEQASVAMFVVNRWMSCTKNSEQIIAVNAIVNPLIFPFGTKHKGLLYRLLLIASSGTGKNYKWIARKKRSANKPLTSKIISEYYAMSLDRATSYAPSFSYDEALECAEAMGYDDLILKKLKNEFK